MDINLINALSCSSDPAQTAESGREAIGEKKKVGASELCSDCVGFGP